MTEDEAKAEAMRIAYVCWSEFGIIIPVRIITMIVHAILKGDQHHGIH